MGDICKLDLQELYKFVSVKDIKKVNEPFKKSNRLFHPEDTIINIDGNKIGGAFKPRISPYSFQGLELDGLKLMQIVKQETGLPIVSELMSISYLDEFMKLVDVIQIGERNMQNYDLLKQVGKTDKPIILKRGLSSTIEEWLLSAEHIMASGNENVILCER